MKCGFVFVIKKTVCSSFISTIFLLFSLSCYIRFGRLSNFLIVWILSIAFQCPLFACWTFTITLRGSIEHRHLVKWKLKLIFNLITIHLADFWPFETNHRINTTLQSLQTKHKSKSSVCHSLCFCTKFPTYVFQCLKQVWTAL